ncbi:Hint domain-containing protein [Methylorubrum aminovorans]
MALPIIFDNKTYGAGFLGIDDGGASAAFSVDAASTYSVTVNGTVTAVGDNVTLTYGADAPSGYAGRSITLTATQYDNADQILFTSRDIPPGETSLGNYRYLLSNSQVFGSNPTPPATRTRFTADDANLGSYNAQAVPCFTTGTLIRTARGEVAIEDLTVADVAVTTSGEYRPIRWIGHRTIDCRRYPDPADVLPVRISAGAMGENRPEHDLLVSPGHAICFDVLGEVLILAAGLVNGTTITQEQVDEVTYWHVELDSHDILIANGQPAESYLDMSNRVFFAESGIVDLSASLDVDPALRTHADFCRPFHSGGAVVDAVRAQLRRRAETLGWYLRAPDTWAGVHLEVDGRLIEPKARGLSACFEVPADAHDVWLVSPTSVPRHVSDNPDNRALGLDLKGLQLDAGLNDVKVIALDDPRLNEGFHDVEPDHRWTAGRAHLPATLFAGLEGTALLWVDLNAPAQPRWIAPEALVDTTELQPRGMRLARAA